MDIKDGDVYSWYYKNDEEYRKQHQGSGTAYWCMDNRCFVVDGKLIDTYWQGVTKDNYSSNARIVDPDKVDLEFICNLNDIRFIDKWKIEDYDKVYNLSHQKGSYLLYAVDKDAQVSNKALLVKYKRKLEEANSEKRSAEYNIEYYSKLIQEIEP